MTRKEEANDVPRLCRLVRNSDEEQYGFDFKTLANNGNNVIDNVRSGFPGDKAGLKDRDYILKVNGESIDGLEHDAIVNKIIAFPTHVEFLVVADLNAYLNQQVK